MKLPRLSLHLRVALLYALFGGVWILVSDWLLSALARDPAVVAHMQTYKGGFFVAASALLILVLLHRELTLRQNTEEELRQSEERFRSAFDNMLEGAQILSRDWRYLYLNPSAEIHNHRPNQELLGNRYTDMWPGIEDTPVFTEIKRCMDGRIPSQMENRFVYPDGAVGWFNLSLQPVPEGILILSLDITERVRAEMQAAQMTRLYATLSQVNQTIVRVKDREELYQSICELAMKFGAFALVWIGLLDEASGEVRPAAAQGADIQQWPFPVINIKSGTYQNQVIGEAIRTSRVVTSTDIQTDERTKSLHRLILRSGFHAIVDVYDALTSDRPYRDGWSKEATIEHIRSECGNHFDPKVVDAFLALVN